MLDWTDLKTILVLTEKGSLAAAAQALGVNYTTVARRVRRAEEALGEPLFERLADGYSPNAAAALVASHAARMRAEEDAMMRQLTGRDARLSGDLVVTAPQLLIAHLLAPVFAGFSADHPEVHLKIKATNDILNLNRREADLALRISRNPGDNLTGLRLTAQHSASFASPDWAARIAAEPDAPIDWIVYEVYQTLPRLVTQAYPSARVRYVFDDMVAILSAAQEGLGVARMPMFLGRMAPGLVQVPVLPPQPYPDVWLVGHPDVWPGAKPRAFREATVAQFKSKRSLFVA